MRGERPRTDNCRLPGVTRPARGQDERGGRQEPLGGPTMLADQEDVALAVRKWLLKRKDGTSKTGLGYLGRYILSVKNKLYRLSIYKLTIGYLIG